MLHRIRRLTLVLLISFLISGIPPAPLQAVDKTQDSPVQSPITAETTTPEPPAPETRTVPPVSDPRLPSLTLAIAVSPDPLQVGATAAVTLTITNQAPDPADDLIVTIVPSDGALALPGPATRSATDGWRWSLARLEGGSSTSLHGQLRVQRLPAGGALLLHAQVTARGLELPVQEIAGALVDQPAQQPASVRFTPGRDATLRSTNGQVEVRFPAGSFGRALTLQHLPAAVKRAQGGQIPLEIAGSKRGLETFFLEAIDDQGRQIHQFSEPLTLTVHYTPEQLRARGLSEAEVTIFWFDEQRQTWVPLETSVDPIAHTATTRVDHFSAFKLGDGSSPSSAYIPSLQGFQVSSFTGAASFSFPIEVPAGPGGLKPSLTLSYSSASTDGKGGMNPKRQSSWVGKGWSLDMPSVALNKTFINEGTGQNYRYYALVLNGQSYDLVRAEALVSNPDENNPTHWAWRPTDESFIRARVVQTGTSDATIGGQVNGVWQPRYTWQIWTKDGTLYEFAEDLWYGWDRCSTANAVEIETYKWLLKRVIDVHGNTMTYSYDRQRWDGYYLQCDWWNYGEGMVDVAAWPTAIEWGANTTTGAVNRYRVEFVSSARANDTQYDYAGNQYGGIDGAPRETRRLDAIKIYSKPGSAWELVRQYNFSYDYSLFSDERVETSPGVFGPNTAYPKLTLKSIQRVGKDGATVLPPSTFSYQTNGGSAYYAQGGWNRINQIANGQGGTVSLSYEHIAPAINNGHFVNYHRVTARTFADGRGNSFTWTYGYQGPKLNSLGSQLTGGGTQAELTSAVLYYNKYWNPNYPYDTWLVHKPHSEFRGHSQVTETAPDGTRTEHYFYQGDDACGWPKDASGNPLTGDAILGNACFQTLRNKEFWKGREYKTRILDAGGTPMKETIRSFASQFYDYGPAPLSGLWRAFSYESQVVESSLDGSNAVSKTTTYAYDVTENENSDGQVYGNLTCVEEFDRGTLIRRTKHYYTINTTNGAYLADRKWATVVFDPSWNMLAYTAYFYDGTNTQAGIGAKGLLTRESKYYDIPSGSLTNVTIHSSDTTYAYDAYGNRISETTYAGPGTAVFNGSSWSFSAPGGGSAASTTTTEYDTTFHVFPIKSTGPSGLVEQAGYDYRMGIMTSVTDPNGNVTSAQYDMFGRLIKLIKPGDSASYPTVEATYADWEQPFRYQVLLREQSGVGGAIRPILKFYDGLGREIQVKSESQNGTQHIVVDKVYDGLGRVIKESQPRYVNYTSGDAAFWYYQPLASDAVERWTTTTYDALGRPKTVTTPDGAKTTHRYGLWQDATLGWITYHDVVDPNRHRTQQRYDSLGRLVQVVEISGDCGNYWAEYACGGAYTTQWAAYATTTYRYSPLDLLTQVVDNAGNVTSMTYDSLGRKTNMSDPDMGAWYYGYDVAGQLVNQTDAKGQTLAFTYDVLGRLTSKLGPDATTTSFSDAFNSKGFGWNWSSYQTVVADGDNNLIRSSGTGSNYNANFSRNAYSLTSGEGVQLRFMVDAGSTAAHFSLESTDANGVYRRFGVIANSNKIYLQYNNGSGWVYPQDLIRSVRLNTWYVLQLTVDDRGGLSAHIYEEHNPAVRGSYSVSLVSGLNWRFHHWIYRNTAYIDDYKEFGGNSYGYDAGANGKGQRTSMSNATTSTSWSYDARGRMIRADHTVSGLAGTRSFQWSYDSADRVTSLTYPTGEVVSTSYDEAWRPTSLCSSLGGCYVSGASYTALDQPDRWSLGNGLVQDWSYHATTQRLSRLQVGTSSNPGLHFDRSYSYDAVGNVSSIVDNRSSSNSQSFGYDHRDRLISWTLGGATESYAYDPLGNLTNKAGVSYSYALQSPWNGGPHAVKSVGGQSYSYDANGNMLSGGGRQYTWTSENLPASIKGPDGIWEYYAYDAESARVKKTRGSATTIYLEGLWEEVVGGSNKTYYEFNEQLVAVRDSATGLAYLHGDHLGSVGLTTDAAGKLLSSQEFDPWGVVRSGGVSQTSLNYTGQRLDGTGLLYYHARMYDPALARFVSADSIVPGMAGGGGGAAATVGPVEEASIRSLTVDFHEVDFVEGLNEENAFTRNKGFYFQLNAETRQQATDPWGPLNPQVLNRYTYVINNPLRYTDPTGHCFLFAGLDTAMCILVWGLIAGTAVTSVAISAYQNPEGARALANLITGAINTLLQFAKRSGKERATDIPDWVRRDHWDEIMDRLKGGERTKDIVDDIFKRRFPGGFDKGTGSEYSKTKKGIERGPRRDMKEKQKRKKK